MITADPTGRSDERELMFRGNRDRRLIRFPRKGDRLAGGKLLERNHDIIPAIDLKELAWVHTGILLRHHSFIPWMKPVWPANHGSS